MVFIQHKKELVKQTPEKRPEHEQVDRAARVFPDQKGEPVKSGDYSTTKKDRPE